MAKKKMKAIDWVFISLLIIGGINWGLVGVFGFNLVESLIGQFSLLLKIVYGAVGISAVVSLWRLIKLRI